MATLRSNVNLNIIGAQSAMVDVVSAVSEQKETLNTACIGLSKPHPINLIREKKYCYICDNTNKDTFVKVKKIIDGDYKIVDKEVLEAAEAPDEVKHQLTLTPHPAEEVDKILLNGKSYYLKPNKPVNTAQYKLYIAMLERHPKTAFVTEWASRSNAALYRLCVHRGILMIAELARPETMNEPPVIIDKDFNPKLLRVSDILVEEAMFPFNRELYQDQKSAKIKSFLSTQEIVNGIPAWVSRNGPAPEIDLTEEFEAFFAQGKK